MEIFLCLSFPVDTGDFGMSLLQVNIFHSANAFQTMQPYAPTQESERENDEKFTT